MYVVYTLKAREENVMQDGEMLSVLRRLCAAYTSNDKSAIQSLEPIATQIGAELHERGGSQEMRRLFSQLNGIQGSRTLDMHWDGIGSWRG